MSTCLTCGRDGPGVGIDGLCPACYQRRLDLRLRDARRDLIRKVAAYPEHAPDHSEDRLSLEDALAYPRPFLLVEHGTHDESRRWYTTHDSAEDAADYHLRQECPGEWYPAALIDLDDETGHYIVTDVAVLPVEGTEETPPDLEEYLRDVGGVERLLTPAEAQGQRSRLLGAIRDASRALGDGGHTPEDRIRAAQRLLGAVLAKAEGGAR